MGSAASGAAEGHLRVEFGRSRITSDAGLLLAVHDLDGVLRLTAMAG